MVIIVCRHVREGSELGASDRLSFFTPRTIGVQSNSAGASGEIGRRAGFRILWALKPVGVQVPPRPLICSQDLRGLEFYTGFKRVTMERYASHCAMKVLSARCSEPVPGRVSRALGRPSQSDTSPVLAASDTAPPVMQALVCASAVGGELLLILVSSRLGWA